MNKKLSIFIGLGKIDLQLVFNSLTNRAGSKILRAELSRRSEQSRDELNSVGTLVSTLCKANVCQNLVRHSLCLMNVSMNKITKKTIPFGHNNIVSKTNFCHVNLCNYNCVTKYIPYFSLFYVRQTSKPLKQAEPIENQPCQYRYFRLAGKNYQIEKPQHK